MYRNPQKKIEFLEIAFGLSGLTRQEFADDIGISKSILEKNLYGASPVTDETFSLIKSYSIKKGYFNPRKDCFLINNGDSIGAIVKKIRISLKKTIIEFSQDFETSTYYIRDWESNDTIPMKDFLILKKLAERSNIIIKF